MFKRVFWIGVGVTLGILAAAKAKAYVKAHTPDTARQFVLGPDQEHVAQRTLHSLLTEFNVARRGKEAELNQRFTRAGE